MGWMFRTFGAPVQHGYKSIGTDPKVKPATGRPVRKFTG